MDTSIALLDGILGGPWNISEHPDQQSFKIFRLITFKLVRPILTCNVIKSSTSVPFSIDYHVSAVESL